MKFFSLNPETYNPNALSSEEGAPFYLAKPNSKVTKKSPDLKVIEEIAKVKNYSPAQAANFNDMMKQITDPLAPRMNEMTTADGTPYYLADKKPDMLQTKVVRKAPAPEIIEELAAVKNKPASRSGSAPVSQLADAPEAPILNVEAQPNPEMTTEDSIIQHYLDLLKKRGQRAGDLEGDYNDLRGSKPEGWQTKDLTPLLGWVDDTYGGNSAKYYKAPTAVKDWEAKVKDARDTMLASEKTLTDDQFNLVAKKMAEDQYKYVQGQENGRNQLDNATKIEVAKIGAQNPNRNMDMGMLNYLLARERFNFDQAKDERSDNKTLSAKLTPHSSFKTALQDAQSALKTYPDAPGLSTSLIFGNVTPDSELSDNGATRRALGRVAQMYGKIISGAAVNEPERRALEIVSGKDWRANPDSIRSALETLANSQAVEEATLRSGFDPRINANIDNRVKSGSPAQAQSAKPKVIIQNGHTYRLNEKTGGYE